MSAGLYISYCFLKSYNIYLLQPKKILTSLNLCRGFISTNKSVTRRKKKSSWYVFCVWFYTTSRIFNRFYYYWESQKSLHGLRSIIGIKGRRKGTPPLGLTPSIITGWNKTGWRQVCFGLLESKIPYPSCPPRRSNIWPPPPPGWNFNIHTHSIHKETIWCRKNLLSFRNVSNCALRNMWPIVRMEES